MSHVVTSLRSDVARSMARQIAQDLDDKEFLLLMLGLIRESKHRRPDAVLSELLKAANVSWKPEKPRKRPYLSHQRSAD